MEKSGSSVWQKESGFSVDSDRDVYGYNIFTAPVKLTRDKDVTTKVTIYSGKNSNLPLLTKVGPGVEYARPIIAQTGPVAVLPAVAMRVGTSLLPVDDAKLEDFISFSRKFTTDLLKPLGLSDVPTFDAWLESRTYPGPRKRHLKEVRETMEGWKFGDLGPKELRVKAFVKTEVFSDFKAPRLICSRSDQFKVMTAPIFSAIDNAVFSNPQFIKKIPIANRPDYIREYIGESAQYFESDYTAFESLFRLAFLEKIEAHYIEHLVQNLPDGQEFVDLYKRAICSTNHISAPGCYVEILGRRMSGEMNTSSGNGMMNLCILAYLSRNEDLRCVVEGDDGLGATNAVLTEQKFADIGIRCKLEHHDHLFDASFCGMTFAPGETAILTDPVDVLHKFGYIPARYKDARWSKKLALLKCKAMSYVVQYHGCPIIFAFCRRILELTRSVDYRTVLRAFDEYEREQILQFDRTLLDVQIGSRYVFEKRYGISIDDQLLFEKQCCTLQLDDDFSVVQFPWLYRTQNAFVYEYLRGPTQTAAFNLDWTQDFKNKSRLKLSAL
jgi:hypothetical protein